MVFFFLLHLEDILYMAISPPESFHKISPCNTILSEASALAFELEADENIWRIANTKTADMSEKTVGCRPHGGGTRHRVPDTHSPDNHTVILHNSLKKNPFSNYYNNMNFKMNDYLKTYSEQCHCFGIINDEN